MIGIKLIIATSIFFVKNIQENAKMTGIKLIEAAFMFVVGKYSCLVWFGVNYGLWENANMTGMMFIKASSILFVKKNNDNDSKAASL